jgi:Fe-S cluster biogenesis protein NfuA
MSMSEQPQDDEKIAFADIPYRFSALAETLMNHPDKAVADQVTELLDWYDLFHREGLGQLVDMIRTWRGEIFLESVGRDVVTGPLLDFYELGETPEADEEAEQAVAAALEEVRPIVESHGGELEVTSIADGVVKVRMKGTCDGCPSSSATLTFGVEEALKKHWPGFRRLEQVDAAEEFDAAKADLECATVPAAPVPEASPEPQAPLLQIRGHEGR